MNGEIVKFSVGWTIETYAIYVEAMQQASREFAEERDRRYAEVNVEKEKALKIKETADLAALQLAREIQTYKDEKANNLRSQIESERGTYPTKGEMLSAIEKIEATVKPLLEYVASDRGHGAGQTQTWGVIAVIAALLVDIGVRFIKP